MKKAAAKKTRLDAYGIFRIILVIAAILMNVKYIFTDFGIDAEFQISMSYRLATGDVMFKEMWEPYQMSAFLCAFFIKIFIELFHTTTGIVLYLQVIGVLLDAGVSLLLYKTVCRHLKSEKTAFLMAWMFFLVSPKDIPIADYTNMQMWFSTLLCIFLFLQYKTGKKRFLVLTALSICGAVLSYPSCLLLYLGVMGILLCRKEYKNALILTGICVMAGGLYLCMVFSQVPIGEFGTVIHNMLALETSHSMSMGARFWWYCKDLAQIVLVFAILYGISFAGIRLFFLKKISDKGVRNILTDAVFLIMSVILELYTVICWQDYVRYTYSIVFLALIAVGMKYARKLSADNKYFYWCGIVISVLQFISTLLLTNLVFVASVPFLLLAALVSFLPLAEVFGYVNAYKYVNSVIRVCVIAGLMVLMFRNVYIIRPMQGDVSSILNIGSVVKEGPAFGIVSEYMGPYIQNESVKEWKTYIKEGQSVYLIGGSLDTLGYLYSDTEIAAPSLVPTPGYNETVLEYWETNPDKYPDVIVASCWYGQLNAELTEDSWIMQWIEDEYCPAYYIDGKYWRYYFKEQ